MPSPTAHILVVDDDQEIARLLRAYLEQDKFQVSVAYDGETAFRILDHEHPHLMVLDLMLPDRDGWDITRTIRGPMQMNIPIIMLTARIEDTDKIVGLELGADDYITKPFNPREVVARVRAVLRRTQQGSGVETLPALEWCGIRLDAGRREVTVDGQPVDLTPTEFELLKTLMENPGYVFTRAVLIERSLGYDYESLERTLDSHIKNLRRKIQPDSKLPSYIQTVYGVGYRLERPAP